jgi:hypothetical protein
MKKQNTLAILSIALLTPLSASAETCTSLPSCSDLGFVYTAAQCDEDGLKKIKCPFGDYYFCSKITCTGYSLTSCPANGNCSVCASGTNIKYKLDSCQSGYTQSGNECQKASDPCADYPGKGSSIPDSECILTYDWCPTDANRYQLTCIPDENCKLSSDGTNCIGSCVGYHLSSCPTGGVCSNCKSGTTTKYKLDSCQSGYTQSGNTCEQKAQTCSEWWAGKSCPTAPGSLVTTGSQVEQSNCPLYLQGDIFVSSYSLMSGETLELENAGDVYDGCTDTASISFTRITPANGRNEIIADIPLTIMEMDLTHIAGSMDLECYEGCSVSLALTTSQDLTLRADKPSTFIIQCAESTSVPCIIEVEGSDTSMVTIAPTGNMTIQDASGGYWTVKNGKATNHSNSKIKIQI